MRFSVNAPIERVHDFMVGRRGAFRQVMRNIRLTQRVKKELDADRPKVGFNTVITSRNYFLFPQLVELLHQLGGEMLNVQTIILYDKVEKVWSLNEEQRADSIKYFRAAVKACRQYGIRTNLASYAQPDIIEKTTEMDRIVDLGRRELRRVKPAHPFLHTFCYEPFYLVTIRANGTVGSCRLFGDEGDNIHTKSFRQIWFGDYFSAARKTLLRGPQPFCSKCGSNEMLEQQRIRVELSRVLN
jgi:MoaA/NifB/PqqE/SkfB family radical SAM enzyme